MKTIILDTNTLMAVGQFKLDIFLELSRICDFKYEIKVVDKTVDELEKIIKEQKGKHVRAAKLGLEILKRKGLKKIKTRESDVDSLLVDLAKKGAIIITQDKELKKRIKEVGGQVMTIRQKKRLILS